MVKMPIASLAAASSNECHHFMKSLLQHFTPSPTPIASQQNMKQQPRLTLKSCKMRNGGSSTKQQQQQQQSQQQQTPIVPIIGHHHHHHPSHQQQQQQHQPMMTTYPTISTCRYCLHTFSQLNSLRQKLRSAHAAYTASQCQDERTFAHIPMLTVRSYRPTQRHRNQDYCASTSSSSSSSSSSLKLEIKRYEPVNALFMADDKWVYVKTSDERRGFIPAKCCQPFALAVEALAHANHHYYCKTQHQENANPGVNIRRAMKQVDQVAKSKTPSPDVEKQHKKRIEEKKMLDEERERKVVEEEDEEKNNEEEIDLNDLSLFSVSYLDLSNAIVASAAAASHKSKSDTAAAAATTTTTTTNAIVDDCVYDNLNEFKSSSSSSSSSSLSADNSSSNQYAYLNEEFEVFDDVGKMTTPCNNNNNKTSRNNVSKKRKRIISPNTIKSTTTTTRKTTIINPYDTLRRCHRQVTIVTPPSIVKTKKSYERAQSPKQTTVSSTEKMLFVRIYKKLRASEANPKFDTNDEYENLDELTSQMTTAKMISSSSSSSEHIYCNADFF